LLAPSNIPSAANDFQGQNYVGWCNEAGNTAIVQATLALSLPERQSFYAQQQAVFTADVPTIPLFARLRVAASAPYVCGIDLNAPNPMLWNLDQWYFDESGACLR
jgi:ABC-type transport system substrate-binding protein